MTERTHSPESVVPLIMATLALDTFGNDWRHCDQTSNYLAQFVSMDRRDPSIFSNRLSTILNEILEFIYNNNSGDGVTVISIGRNESDLCLEFTIPVDEANRRQYDDALDPLAHEDSRVLYQREIERLYTGPLHPAMGLWELAADYEIRFAKRVVDPASIIVSVWMSISDDED